MSALEQFGLIGEMTRAMSRATHAEELYRHALDAIARVTGSHRASVLLFDPDGVMRFKAWRGLSDAYRSALEGHTPWRAGQPDPDPLLIPDVDAEPSLLPHLEGIRAEGITAMAMIPLAAGGGTIGKVMVYYSSPHELRAAELELLRHIAAHTSFALDRQRVVDALEASRRQFEAMVDDLRVVVFRSDAAGVLHFVNRAWEEITGFTAAEARGQSAISFVHEPDREIALAGLRSLAARGLPSRHSEFRLRTRSGETRWVEAFGRATFSESGVAVGISGTLTDITERKASAEALRDAEVRVREAQRLESLGLLAGGIAHDFNNLLMGVLGNATIALEDLPPEAAVRPIVQDIELAARSAADLTRQLLAYSGRGKFVVQRIDLPLLVQETVRLLGGVVSAKAHIDFEAAGGVPPVEGDSTQLRQVLMNLIINASDALGGRRGEIRVRTSALQADLALLRGSRTGGDGLAAGPYVSLEVTDTGSGMDAATLGRVFDPFFTTKFQGRGLGLAAALGILRGHHGAIFVDSAPGLGTTFRLLLPAMRTGARTPPSQPALTAIPPKAGPRWTILLVDDEALVRQVSQRMLERAGHRVLAVAQGREALKVLATQRAAVDAVLLDLTMPEFSGAETFAALRQQWPDLPVVLTSGFTAEAAGLITEGPTNFLQKPYGSQHEVAAAIRHAIDRAS